MQGFASFVHRDSFPPFKSRGAAGLRKVGPHFKKVNPAGSTNKILFESLRSGVFDLSYLR